MIEFIGLTKTKLISELLKKKPSNKGCDKFILFIIFCDAKFALKNC